MGVDEDVWSLPLRAEFLFLLLSGVLISVPVHKSGFFISPSKMAPARGFVSLRTGSSSNEIIGVSASSLSNNELSTSSAAFTCATFNAFCFLARSFIFLRLCVVYTRRFCGGCPAVIASTVFAVSLV